MGAAKELSSSLSCEIAIIQAKNIEFTKSHDNLFVRYYLSAGNNKRVQLNTKEISSKSNLFWNESYSLECLSTEDSINALKEQTVVFELRWRNRNPIMGKMGRSSSRVVGRAEIPWKAVVESPNMEMEKWVMMVQNKKRPMGSVLDGDVKPPSVQIGMRIRIPDLAMEKKKKKRNGRLRKRETEECGCCVNDNGCSCRDYEIFALVAAFEAL